MSTTTPIAAQVRAVIEMCGAVSHDEADEMVTRFIASHFNGRMGSSGEHARITIPADPKRDDDLRLSAYIEQQRAAERSTAALREAAERLANDVEQYGLSFSSEQRDAWQRVEVSIAALRSLLGKDKP